MTRARELADLLTGGQTITTADNSAQLTLESTDADAAVGPLLDMIRDSASPANDDTLGRTTVCWLMMPARLLLAQSLQTVSDGRMAQKVVLKQTQTAQRVSYFCIRFK